MRVFINYYYIYTYLQEDFSEFMNAEGDARSVWMKEGGINRE